MKNGQRINPIAMNPVVRTAGTFGRGFSQGLGDLLSLLSNKNSEVLSPLEEEIILERPNFNQNSNIDVVALYDMLTNNQYQPQDLSDEIGHTVGELMSIGGAFNKGVKGAKAVSSVLPQLPEKINKIGRGLGNILRSDTPIGTVSTATAGLGSALGAQSEDKEVGSLLGGLAGGITPSLGTGIARGAKSLMIPDRRGINALESLGMPQNDKGEGTLEALQGLLKKAEAEKVPINNTYAKAREMAGSVMREDADNLLSGITRDLEEQFIYPDLNSEASSWLRSLAKATRGTDDVPLNKLEGLRENLNAAIRDSSRSNSPEVSGRQLNAIKKAFDSRIDSSIMKTLSSGNKDALREFKDARKLKAQWAEKYARGDKKDFGQNYIADFIQNAGKGDIDFTPETVVNNLFGMSELGFSAKSPYIVKALENVLPPEAMNQVKGDFVSRLLKPITVENPTRSQIGQFQKNLKKVKNENHTLYNSMLNESQRSEIDDLVKDLGGAENRSQLMQRLQRMQFIGPVFEMAWDDLAMPAARTSKSLLPVVSGLAVKSLGDDFDIDAESQSVKSNTALNPSDMSDEELLEIYRRNDTTSKASNNTYQNMSDEELWRLYNE